MWRSSPSIFTLFGPFCSSIWKSESSHVCLSSQKWDTTVFNFFVCVWNVLIGRVRVSFHLPRCPCTRILQLDHLSLSQGCSSWKRISHFRLERMANFPAPRRISFPSLSLSLLLLQYSSTAKKDLILGTYQNNFWQMEDLISGIVWTLYSVTSIWKCFMGRDIPALPFK